MRTWKPCIEPILIVDLIQYERLIPMAKQGHTKQKYLWISHFQEDIVVAQEHSLMLE